MIHEHLDKQAKLAQSAAVDPEIMSVASMPPARLMPMPLVAGSGSGFSSGGVSVYFRPCSEIQRIR